MQLRFNGIQHGHEILWAFRCVENWIAQDDPETGGICAFRQGDYEGYATRTKTGVTFNFSRPNPEAEVSDG